MARIIGLRAMLMTILGGWLLAFWQFWMTAGHGNLMQKSASLGVFFAILASPIAFTALFLFFISASAFHLDVKDRLVVRRDSWLFRLLRWGNSKVWERPKTACSIFWRMTHISYAITVTIVFAAGVIAVVVLGIVYGVRNFIENPQGIVSAAGGYAVIGAGIILGLLFLVWFFSRPMVRALFRAFKDKTCPVVYIK